MDFRNTVETALDDIKSMAARGNVHTLADKLHEICSTLLDMIEHHAGIDTKAAKAAAKAEVNKVADRVEGTIANLTTTVGANTAAIQVNADAIAEAQAAAPEAVEPASVVLNEQTPTDAVPAADEAPEASTDDADKKPSKAKKKAD